MICCDDADMALGFVATTKGETPRFVAADDAEVALEFVAIARCEITRLPCFLLL